MLSSNSSIATPFFKQLIVEESSDDFLLEQDRCLLFFKHLEGRTLEARDFRKLKINLFLKEYREIDNYYPCMLIKENFSWISKDDNGEYRYFSRKPNGRVFVFDILDLFQIGYKMNYKELASFFRENLSIEIYNKFLKSESDKYTENIEYIKTDRYLSSKTKAILKEKEDIYIELNKIGLENLFSKVLSKNDEAMFFASTSYIKDRLLDKYSNATINKVVNIFSVVGLINKIKEEDIPVEFRESNKRKVQNFTSYYSIPNIKNKIDDIDIKSGILIDNKLCYYNLTKKKVLDLFGDDDYYRVYVQKTYDGKQHSNDERSCLVDIFFNLYNEFNYVSKDLFYNNSPKGYSKSFIFNEFDEIAKLNGFKVVRPNNRLKNKLGITGNNNVAIR